MGLGITGRAGRWENGEENGERKGERRNRDRDRRAREKADRKAEEEGRDGRGPDLLFLWPSALGVTLLPVASFRLSSFSSSLSSVPSSLAGPSRLRI